MLTRWHVWDDPNLLGRAPAAPLIVGSAPWGPEDIAFVAKDLRATALLSLQSDADLASRGLTWSTLWAMHTREGLRAERVPIVDFDPRDLTRHLAAAVERAEALLAGGHRLYLHCTAGLNRSATVAVAVRARMLGALSEALAELADIHPTAVVADKALHRWAKKHL